MYDDIAALPPPPLTPPAQTQGVAKGCKVFLQFSSRITLLTWFFSIVKL